MDKPYIICHILSALDGKIAGEFATTKSARSASEEYVRIRSDFVGTAQDIAKMIAEFVPIARAVIGVRNLKISTFGPRPQDFFACNAPIKGLYELGVEIEENSELDLLVSYKAHAGNARIPAVCEDMAREMGEGKYYPDLCERMAQYELTPPDLPGRPAIQRADGKARRLGR